MMGIPERLQLHHPELTWTGSVASFLCTGTKLNYVTPTRSRSVCFLSSQSVEYICSPMWLSYFFFFFFERGRGGLKTRCKQTNKQTKAVYITVSISASDHVSAVFSIYKVLCLESNLLKSTTVSTRVKIEKRNGFVLFYIFLFFFIPSLFNKPWGVDNSEFYAQWHTCTER